MIPAAPSDNSFRASHWLLLCSMAMVCSIYTIVQWGLGYIDFGDGNYMYIASRIAQGAVVYRDILAPQPPCHLFAGAALVKLSQLFGAASPLYFFRTFSLVIHLLTFVLIIKLALRAWGRPTVALAAGAIYLWLPIGFWWALGYQSEPLENVFLLAMILSALKNTRRADIMAGLYAALAGLTNATAAPFLLVLIIYMLATTPRRALVMSVPCIILVALVTGILQAWTGGAYLDNVVFNQVGTYPPGFWPFLNYAWGKLLGQGSKVLFREGAFLILALLGLIRLTRESLLAPQERAGLGWFCAATMGAIIYVTKGGTADYIFSLSEPAVAILAAGELAALYSKITASPQHRPLALMAAAMLALVALHPGIDLHRMVFTQSAYELNAERTAQIKYQIEHLSAPGEPIMAPPFYAVIADRPLLGDYSELFIWNISYWNDLRKIGNGQGVKKVNELATDLRARKSPLVILEMAQTGAIPEIMFALKAGYIPIKLDRMGYLYPTLNTRLGAFVPAKPGQDATTAWNEFETALLNEFGGDAGKFSMWLAAAARAR